VALVSSGDSGVYGMASPVYELASEFLDVKISVVPGVTAALSGGAVLGAPLGHDFVVISLSDLLPPWEIIEKRLRSAAAGDFVIAIYNPGSHGRPHHLRNACRILLESLPPKRVCGIVSNICRAGERAKLTTLEALGEESVDMGMTIFVGNSRTKILGGKLVTPRGYLD
jgi:precorrin-3B C17-methyltransferase